MGRRPSDMMNLLYTRENKNNQVYSNYSNEKDIEN